jgi:hypothetical protein
MEWITAVLGALIAVLGMQVFHWRTLAKLGARVHSLELAIEELQNPEEEDLESYGRQGMDIAEYRDLLTQAPPELTPLPVVRHMTVPALLNLLPRKGIRLQPSLDGMGLKVTASYRCMEDYKHDVGEDLHQDMKQLVANTGPDWELTSIHNMALMQYEFRIMNHGGGVHE